MKKLFIALILVLMLVGCGFYNDKVDAGNGEASYAPNTYDTQETVASTSMTSQVLDFASFFGIVPIEEGYTEDNAYYQVFNNMSLASYQVVLDQYVPAMVNEFGFTYAPTQEEPIFQLENAWGAVGVAFSKEEAVLAVVYSGDFERVTLEMPNPSNIAENPFMEDSFQNWIECVPDSDVAPTEVPSVCPVCHGTKMCVTCNGLKHIAMYGQDVPCSACEGTGKCWNCSLY